MSETVYKMFINGESTDSVGEESTTVRNPANYEEIVGVVPKGTEEDVRIAVDAADEAFENTWWSDPYESRQRGRILWKASESIARQRTELATTLTKEQGKPLSEALGEVDSFANTLEYYAGYGGKISSSLYYVKDGDNKLEIKELKRPMGVCGAILPWNFPVSLLGWKLGAGLITGNTFVVKPASTTPLTDLLLAQILNRSGVPDGVVNVVTGPSYTVGKEIVQNPKIRRVAFTGSTETGKSILLTGASQIKHITLELGGSDPTIVCNDADLDLAAETIVYSGRFRNAGQSCTSVKRLYVFDTVADKLIERLRENVEKMRLGNGLDSEVDMGPLHNEDQRGLVEGMVEEAVNRGAKVIAGGERPEGEPYGKGYFYKPTLLVDVDEESTMLREECFGPALPIQRVADMEEAIERANASPYGLGASIWSSGEENIRKFEERVESGIKWINYKPASVPETAFGGVKDSGIGRELGRRGLEEYLETIS
ncbi:MAG: aldehyde dehydrogenase family protein, partial [Candidatus Geothermarchaeales archaeon]